MKGLICDDDRCERVVEILKAVAHPLRLRLIAVLSQNETHVQGLAEELQVNQAAVSQQLRILRMCGLVGSSRQGTFSYYRLTEPRLLDLLQCMNSCTTT